MFDGHSWGNSKKKKRIEKRHSMDAAFVNREIAAELLFFLIG
jgi:hypothetical protein